MVRLSALAGKYIHRCWDRIKNVAERVQETYEAANAVVVVVSARSGVTNDLITRAKALNSSPDEREDRLLGRREQETIALTTMVPIFAYIPAVSRTGRVVFDFTDPNHTRAELKKFPGDLKEQLAAGKVAILAGFQGHSNLEKSRRLGVVVLTAPLL